MAGQNLEIEISRYQRFLIGCRHLTIPLQHVMRAERGKRQGFGMRLRYIKPPGNPRLKRDYGLFICARYRAPALRIELRDDPYDEVILSVPDPERIAQAIRDAVAAQHGRSP